MAFPSVITPYPHPIDSSRLSFGGPPLTWYPAVAPAVGLEGRAAPAYPSATPGRKRGRLAESEGHARLLTTHYTVSHERELEETVISGPFSDDEPIFHVDGLTKYEENMRRALRVTERVHTMLSWQMVNAYFASLPEPHLLGGLLVVEDGVLDAGPLTKHMNFESVHMGGDMANPELPTPLFSMSPHARSKPRTTQFAMKGETRVVNLWGPSVAAGDHLYAALVMVPSGIQVEANGPRGAPSFDPLSVQLKSDRRLEDMRWVLVPMRQSGFMGTMRPATSVSKSGTLHFNSSNVLEHLGDHTNMRNGRFGMAPLIGDTKDGVTWIGRAFYIGRAVGAPRSRPAHTIEQQTHNSISDYIGWSLRTNVSDKAKAQEGAALANAALGKLGRIQVFI